jgi:hypothetical protein
MILSKIIKKRIQEGELSGEITKRDVDGLNSKIEQIKYVKKTNARVTNNPIKSKYILSKI